MFNKKLKDENQKLRYRIKELEERLCPCRSHDWKLVDTRYRLGSRVEDIDTIYHYQCARCGKEKREVGF